MSDIVNVELSSVYINSTHTHTHISDVIDMENDTVIPVVSDCGYEHNQLWIAAMVTVSAISTLVALILRKRATRAQPLPREGHGINMSDNNSMTVIRDAGV